MSQNKYKSIQDLVDNYIASGLSAREYVEARVDAGDLSAAEALKLLSILRDAQSVTFKLAEVSDDEDTGLHMVLIRKEEEGHMQSPPLFSIEIDETLNYQRDEVIDLLQKFAKELAVLATRGELEEAEAVDTIDDNPEDWLDHPNILPASETRH